MNPPSPATPDPWGDISATVAGCRRAEEPLRKIAADPSAPFVLTITGPGGCGKTTVLEAIARLCARSEVRVCGLDAASWILDDPGHGVVLIDDAHRIDATGLDLIGLLAQTPGVRLAVAYRPWPRRPALDALALVSSPVVLGHLDRSQLAERAGALLGHPPTAAVLDWLCARTAGLPRLVDQLVLALRDSGAVEQPAPQVEPVVVERLRDDLREELGAELGAEPNDELDSSLDRRVGNGLGPLGPRVFRLLLARALGATADVALLAQVLDMSPADVSELADAARASGLVGPEDALVPLVCAAITSLASVLAAGAPTAGTPTAGTPAAGVLTAAAPPQRCTARRAEAAALTGHLDEALRLADQVIADPAAVERARGTLVAAAVLAHRGLLARSAELYRWLDSAQPGTATPLTVVALLGTGELARADSVRDSAMRDSAMRDSAMRDSAMRDSAMRDDPSGLPDRPPTLLAGAQSLMARGLYDSVTGSPTSALSTLTRAAALLEPAGHTAVLPDTPAALAGLVALHVGHFDVAESVLDRAIEHQLGGLLAQTRHRLLRAWTAMLRGDHPLAHALLQRSTPQGRLEPRDELLAAALQVGLARRGGDQPALHDAWRRAREAIVRHPVDLLALLPLGELAIGAARLREQSWLAPQLAEAYALLDRLGNPPLWATPLHWNALHAAIIAQQPQEAKQQAKALTTAAHQHSPYATVLAMAGESWLQVMSGVIDAAAVETAARSLHAVGLTWEGSRLAGQAAIRTTNRKEMSGLLALARSLHRGAPGSTAATAGGGSAGQDDARGDAREGSGPGSRASTGAGAPGDALTGREREIATLLLANLTYKQIGERLFISAKTVEHHVARMRQRLGSDDRADLLAQLRHITTS